MSPFSGRAARLAFSRSSRPYQLVKRGSHVSSLVGLAQKSSASREVGFRYDCLTRGNDQGHGWPSVSDYARQSQAVHRTRHMNIGENGANVITAFEDTDGFISI